MREKAASRQEVEIQGAQRRIESFGNRFGQPHLWFACHAALPLALDADLLYCLWANFQRNIKGKELEIPWIAVADLMFSGLLWEVGYETYQMDRVVRNILLKQLKEDENFGQQRIGELAQFLRVYVQPMLKSEDLRQRDFAQVQGWTALAYTQPIEAVRRLAGYYRVALESGTELVRMESLVETLAEPLGEFRTLLIYAHSLGNYARGHIQLATAQLKEVPRKGKEIKVAGVSLPIPKELEISRAWTRRRLLQIAGGTALVGGGLATAWLWPKGANKPRAVPENLPEPGKLKLEPFEFDVKTVDAGGKVTEQRKSQALFFSQDLGNDIALDMITIPGGSFLMGTEDGEIERLVEKFSSNYFRVEKPQHRVTVQPFFMGKFQITQAQWKAIAYLPKVEIELRAAPSNFKGDDLPVERVSWLEAEEFCKRLSSLIGGRYKYRLPTEAEWEYACRAGTTTPFHFGETITSELANYNARYTFASEPKGKYRGKTTSVGSFSPNAFGLYDMHGQVWEWCEDDWHDSYKDAPTDGSAWISGNSNIKVIRGGSWYINPWYCHSAYRLNVTRGYRGNDLGLRVVCVVSRTT